MSGISATSADLDHPDIPVCVPLFESHAKRCKLLLILLLPAAIAFHVLAVQTLSLEANYESLSSGASTVAVVLLAITDLLVVVSLLRPLRIDSRNNLLRNEGFHRFFVAWSFAALLVVVVLTLGPRIAYTLYTKASAPVNSQTWHDIGRIAASIAVWLVSGCIRRGPKRHYAPRLMVGAFGLARQARLPDDQPNVFDWSNCSYLSLIAVLYVRSGLAQLMQIGDVASKSRLQAQLDMADLPHLEQSVRQSAITALGTGLKLHERRLWTAFGLLWTCWKSRTWIIISSLMLDGLRTLLGYLQIICTREIIKSFETGLRDKSYPEVLCLGFFLGQTVYILITTFVWVRENYRLHLPVRMTLAAILFDKILHTADVQTTNKEGKGRAEVMNLILTDNERVASLATIFPNVTNSIITIVVGSYLLWSMLGISAFIGLCVLPVSIPISAMISRKTLTANRELMSAMDVRMKAISEFLANSKVIKLNAFEGFYADKIAHLRDIQVVWLRWLGSLRIWLQIVGDQVPVLAILVTFFLYTKIYDHPLEPSTAFVALNLFTKVRSSCSALPGVVNDLLATKVSLDRLAEFLNREEIEEPTWDIADPAIDIRNATVAWPGAGESAFRMEKLSVTLPVGKMTLVHGPIAAGKTLFLRALLGEASILSGDLRAPRSAHHAVPVDPFRPATLWDKDHWLNDSVAYAPQQAYIRHGTIRDNIVYGQAWWPERYQEALFQASLLPDLEIMADGDETEIGEKGINLSGGQKARINIARCLYSRARTVYMDDVLSAVDAHTARSLVDRCFGGPLFKGRTLVLVSHHVNLCLEIADYVVSLDAGRIVTAGDSTKVADLLDLESIPATVAGTPPEEKEQTIAVQKAAAPRKLVSEEHRVTGMTSFKDFLFVLTAAGGAVYWVMLAAIFMGDYGIYILQVEWLKHWTSDPSTSHLDWNLIVYAALFSAGVLSTAFKLVWLYGIGSVGFTNGASRKIHRQMVDAITKAPLRWFETVPTGRLTNVFARDMSIIDQASPQLFSGLVQTIIAVVSSGLIVCLQAPAMFGFIILFTAPVYYLFKFLRKLRADIKRLSASASSPLVSLYHDAIDGVVMVRAFGSANHMASGMLSLINRERQTSLTDWATFNAINASTQVASSSIVTVAALFLVHKDVSAAEAGFYLTFALNATAAMSGLLMITSVMEMVFVSAERVGGYVRDTPQEPIGGEDPKVHGQISFQNVSARYDESLPLVLDDLSFDIPAGTRVGIVGATGSGKSTITLAILRAVDVAHGSIRVDGIDIRDLDLHALRLSLNMVTQDAVLTSGTLRASLDPLGQHSDPEIHDTLARVHLSEMMDLNTPVAPGGGNFSHGQRQLLCLARSLLKRSKILIMDEATSSVDFEMDAKITATLETAFRGVTMVIIAHRLATIINLDRVVLLDRGKLVEIGNPKDLMCREDSAFRRLCMAEGEAQFEELRSLAGLH